MPAKLLKHGKSISASKVEIQGVSKFGIWILVDDQEFFLSFKCYPWFHDATISQISNVLLTHGKFLQWPDLDVDLDLNRLKNPARYPLVFKK